MRKLIGISLITLVATSSISQAQPLPEGDGYVSLGHHSFEGSVAFTDPSVSVTNSSINYDGFNLLAGRLFGVGSVKLGPELSLKRGNVTGASSYNNGSTVEALTGSMATNGIGLKVITEQDWGTPFASFSRGTGSYTRKTYNGSVVSGDTDVTSQEFTVGVELEIVNDLYSSMSVTSAAYEQPESRVGAGFSGTSFNFAVGYRF